MSEQHTGSEGFATRAVHEGQAKDPSTGAVVPPIYMTSTYVQQGIGQLTAGYEYSRAENPTRAGLEQQLASLEGGAAAYAFSSGMAAIDAALRALVRAGDAVLLADDGYGGTNRLLTRVYAEWGVDVRLANLADGQAVSAALSDGRVRVLWAESPSNPLLNVHDIAALAAAAHAGGALLVVDNTVATPYLQRPLSLGADVVVHSTTKYLGGHSDVMGGAVVVADPDVGRKVHFVQFAAGAISSPMDAWLISRATKSLPVRMERHSASALAIARWLEADPRVERVYYPGLESHPRHDVAVGQMRAFSGLVSVALAGDTAEAAAARARTVAQSLRLFQLGESLGGVESLVGYPSEMSHGSLRGTPLAIPENVIRLSVGLEDVGDLQTDLDAALGRG